MHSKKILCSIFAALISIGAFIKIPVPFVPFTLQFLFTTLAGLLLGSKYGALSVVIYILLGLMGVPVFASGGGISYVLQPSFGYLPGFALGAYVTGKIAEASSTQSYKLFVFANFIGLLIVYAFGMIYYALISKFYLGNFLGFWPLFLYCFLLAVPGDIAICFAAGYLAKILKELLKNELRLGNFAQSSRGKSHNKKRGHEIIFTAYRRIMRESQRDTKKILCWEIRCLHDNKCTERKMFGGLQILRAVFTP